ncbi:hypothetical protein PJM42_0063 [Salmonella phage vB_SenP_UTK0001]|nr:hypothetical protein PJM42_0063 [Salmonella phage vB_SenP_UTK0001]
MYIWLLIGLVITIYILFIREKSEEAKAKNKRIKEAYADDVLYYCIKTPAAVFWVGVFSLLWPLIIYVEFFWKKDKKED